MFCYRPFDFSLDAPRYVELSNREGGTPMTVEHLKRDQENRQALGRPFLEKTATTADGLAVGFAYIGPALWASEDRRTLHLLVDSAYRRQGIGSQFFAEMLEWGINDGAASITGRVSDIDADSIAFVENRGFTRRYHSFASVLTVAEFDETPFAGAIDRCLQEGFRLVSLAEWGDTEEHRRKLYDLNILAAADEPTHDGSVTPYEEFVQQVFHAWWYRADGQFLALHGETPIGIAAMGHNQDDRQMFHAFTGTHPEYRGRGIALALKLLTIRLAKREQVVTIRTSNDSRNPAMLSINNKLGYVRGAGKYQVQRDLNAI